MNIEFDPAKAAKALEDRGLDFRRADEVFAGPTLSEDRVVTIGRLDEEVVVIVWTKRTDARRIVSMRKANKKERRFYEEALSRSG